MRELDECLELRRKINKETERIEQLRAVAYSPKNQIISDMPRSNRQINTMDEYIIKLENLETKKAFLECELCGKWCAVLVKLSFYGINPKVIHLLTMRFNFGYSWKKCARIMSNKYSDDNWNENKVFREYRQALAKLTKQDEKDCAK